MPLERFSVAGPAATSEAAESRQPLASSPSALLAIFDSNQDRAEEKYRQLHEKLVRYFVWNRSAEPEDMAQEALKRGLTRLREGQQITTENPEGYFFGIGRNLVREGWNALKREPYQQGAMAYWWIATYSYCLTLLCLLLTAGTSLAAKRVKVGFDDRIVLAALLCACSIAASDSFFVECLGRGGLAKAEYLLWGASFLLVVKTIADKTRQAHE